MSAVDEMLASNADFARGFQSGGLPAPPSRRVAVLTCMDARVDPARALGLGPGEAHVIRNAGGVATADAVRSLLISQQLLGTEEIVVVHHTNCGMLGFRDDEVKDRVEAETGIRPDFALEAFTDLDGDVRQTLARLQASPFLRTDRARGFVYDVDTGRLREVG